MNFLKKLGKNLRKIRDSKDITQAQLAEICDVSISTIARLEIGECFLTFKTLEKIASGLEIQIEDMFDFSSLKSNDESRDALLDEIRKQSNMLSSAEDLDFILNVIRSYHNTQKFKIYKNKK